MPIVVVLPVARAGAVTGAPSLRPLGVGERIDASVKLYLHSFRTLAPGILVVAAPIAVVFGLLGWWQSSVFKASTAPLVTRNLYGTDTFHWGVLRAQLGSEGTTVVLGVAVFVLAKGVAYRTYADGYLARPATWRSGLAGGLRRAGSLLWIECIVVGVVVAAVVLTAIVVLALVPLGPAADVLMVAPCALCLCFVLWCSVAFRMSGPTVLMEDIRGVRAVRRSVALANGSWWSLFGTTVLASLLLGVGTLVADALLRLGVDRVVPTTSLGPHAFVLDLLEQLVFVVLVLPYDCAIGTVLAVDLRVRREGLDLLLRIGATSAQSESARALEPPARHSGPRAGPWGGR